MSAGPARDVMWLVEVEPEVEQWVESLSVGEFATVVVAVERLAEDGSRLRFPASRSGDDGLFEIPGGLGRVARRVTFCFAEDRRVVLLATFSQAGAERAGRSPAVGGRCGGASLRDIHLRRNDGASGEE